MAREIGSLYYTLGIKGSADFQKTLEQARQSVLKMPKGSTTAGVTTFNSKQLSKFGSEIDRVMRSGAATFNAEMSRSITKQSRDLEAMVAQLGPTSMKGKAIQKILDIRNASGGGIETQKASPNEIIRALKQKERFELSLEKPTKQRRSSESVLKGLLDSGTIKEGEAFTEHLRAGSAELAIQEGLQNKLRDATLATNKSVADAHFAYQQSGQSASDLLELQQKLNLAAHEEQKARNSILSTQERQRANALNDKYAFVESRGNKYSRESVMLGNTAFNKASSDRRMRVIATATASVDADIEKALSDLDENHKDQTTDAAIQLKLYIDGLVRKRERLAEIASQMDDFIESQGLAPRSLPNSANFAIEQEAAKEDILKQHADLTGTSAQEQVSAFNKAEKQREIDAIVSNTKAGRYTGLQSQSTDEIKKAQDLLNKNAAGTISLTRDQEAALKNHITQWQKLGQLSRSVLDIMSKMVDEEELLSKAMSAGDSSGVEQHRKNLNALSNDLDKAVSAVNKHNSGIHDASVENGRWNTQMMELGYGVQDFVQVLAGGGGLSAALRGASNNFSQFFAVGGGPQAALMATGMALGTLGISVAMEHLGNNTESTTKKFDDLIERLRTAENISKEYAKHGTNMLEASFGEGSSVMPQIAALQIELASSKKIMDQALRGELQDRGEGSLKPHAIFGTDFKGREAKGLSYSEAISAGWNSSNLTEDTVFGRASNSMTNSWAAQGVFERVLKQVFVEQRRPDQIVMPEMLMESLTKREKEIFAELTSTYRTTNESGVTEHHFKYKDKLDEAMRLYVEAGGVASDEMKKFANQIGEATEKLKMLIEVQTRRTAAYVSRTKLLAATERSMSSGSGEYANQRRGKYADDLIEASKEYADAKTGTLKDLAVDRAKSAMSGFSNIATGGKFEGPASELANTAASASEANLERKSRLNQIFMNQDLPKDIRDSADKMIKSLDSQLPDQIMSGARKIASGITPDQRIGESLSAMQERVNKEISDFTEELKKLRDAGRLTADQFSELEKITRSMSEATKILIDKNKSLRGIDVAMAGGIGADKRREDEDFLRREVAINKDFINATSDIQTEFAKSAKTEEDVRVRDARTKDAETRKARSMSDLEADRKKAALDREMRRFEYAIAGSSALRGDKEYGKDISAAKRRYVEEITAAEQELKDNKDQDLYNKRAAAAGSQFDTEVADIKKQYIRNKFSSNSMFGSDIAANLGGREGRKYQEEMNRIERRRRIEDDKFMTPEQKNAALTTEEDLYNSNMKQIDRKNVSFTDVGSVWKTIQGSLQSYDKKMLDYWKQYMDLARNEGVRVKMAIGN